MSSIADICALRSLATQLAFVFRSHRARPALQQRLHVGGVVWLSTTYYDLYRGKVHSSHHLYYRTLNVLGFSAVLR